MTEIIVAIIAGGLSLIGVIFSNKTNSNKIQQQLAVSQAVTDTKIEELTREVREHNNFAQRVPVLEEQIRNINKTIEELQNEKHKKHKNF